MSPQRSRTILAAGLVGALATSLSLVAPSSALAGGGHHGGGHRAQLPKVPTMTGYGGAVASVDRDASQAGIDVLRRGGNAADAAIATAAMLGVVEPYTSGIGGGGFFVWRDGRTGRVTTIDGREAAPASFTDKAFIDPATGTPLPFTTAVNSGLSVGVPGTPALWQRVLDRHGTKRLGSLLEPAERKAVEGIVVDQSFHDLTAENEARFATFPETSRVFLRDGKAPAVGSRWNNPDIARAYREIRLHGVDSIYHGALGRALVAEARNPSAKDGVSVPKGQITMADLAAYRALDRQPTHARYRGLDVYGMGVPSSGGIAVGEILNLLEAYDQRTGRDLSEVSDAEYLHRFSEASATAFADRNRWVGDVPGVPTRELLSQGFANERACTFSESTALPRPVPFGSPDGAYAACAPAAGSTPAAPDGRSTTSLSVSDRWGNVVSFTTTIEQYGGSGITVPGWGFLLNNELTDFNFAPLAPGVPDPNLPGPGKRPRSSMSPTIILRDGQPYLSVGSPGGATIITTVAQVITEYLDRDKALVDAIAAPRLSSRNGTENAEQALLSSPEGAALRAQGHVLALQDPIGNAVAIRLLGHGKAEAAAETTRRGGGSAMVVRPTR
ncbi:gamma-glutamyltransferase 1 Threonine peptidase. MEROPS family T03 [Pedococcus dokdonensis]|uniref:Gamma-glutamyltransferase 1 Threonine peptidase. MEROPS family T03 n=1 Tax=Pedococcus dokdonensis TaxID=443156 RepID=A0A1H0Q731_9MICO|nr:gamma-glutamyltransferase family protein [Pedococcus dokdonensis]SDP12960.1 gamma-glutamyltransferase 1 Threonine peptidase. MEROPS family T03 [Pedococcus dokdonensis]